MTQVVEGKGKLMDNLSNYIIVDIGANLTNKKFSRDLDQVIQRATDSGKRGGGYIYQVLVKIVHLTSRTKSSIIQWFHLIEL